jgi:hypothetical protein
MFRPIPGSSMHVLHPGSKHTQPLTIWRRLYSWQCYLPCREDSHGISGFFNILEDEPEALGTIGLFQTANGSHCRYFIAEKLFPLNGILHSTRFSHQGHKFDPFDPLLPHFVAVGWFDGWLGSVSMRELVAGGCFSARRRTCRTSVAALLGWGLGIPSNAQRRVARERQPSVRREEKDFASSF